MMNQYPNDFSQLNELAISTGQLVMSYYRGNNKIQIKADKSPVTLADLAANDYIVKTLKAFTPNIPIIAEESNNIDFNKLGEVFWLVDPIDGTRGFIKADHQFSINIALIANHQPVFGLIYLPVDRILYYTKDQQAYRQIGDSKAEIIKSKVKNQQYILIGSDINNSKMQDFIKQQQVTKVIKMNSSIKFCLMAEGKGDIYPHFNRTMEWDTAAGHALLNAAGGRVCLMDNKPLTYQKSNFINPSFIAYSTNY